MIPRFFRKYSIALACISGLMSFSAYTGCQVAGTAHSSRSEEVGSQTAHSEQEISVATPREEVRVVVGAERTELLLPLLRDKRVALVANATSVVGTEREHLLDHLLRQGVNVVKILGPEHGFRGDADAGATVKDERDGNPYRFALRQKQETYSSNVGRRRCAAIRYAGCRDSLLYLYQYAALCDGGLCRGAEKADRY